MHPCTQSRFSENSWNYNDTHRDKIVAGLNLLDSARVSEVGGAIGKQPRTASHFVTKTGKTPAFMRIYAGLSAIGNFTNCNKKGEFPA